MKVLWLSSPVLAATLAFLTFLPTLDAAFVNWDDEITFLRNPHYRGLGAAQLRFDLTTTLLSHWSPLTWVTWSVNYALGGLDPWGYHLGSVLLHCAAVAVFCLVARRLLAAGYDESPRSPAIAAGALVAALIFGLHPLRAESVAWASARRDVLCGLFYLLAVLAYLRGVAGGGRIAGRWWALSIAAFTAALLSKAMAMTLPLTLLLLDVYPLRRRAVGWRALALEKLPYALLAVGAGTIAVLARQEGGNITAYDRYGVGARVALTGYTFWFYPWKLIWPTALAPIYELPARVDFWQWRFLIPLAGTVAVTAALVALRRRWPAGLAAWVSSAIVLAPISGVVHSGSQLAQDRYSYLSGLGFAALAGAGLTWALRRSAAAPGRPWLRPLAITAAALVVVALGIGAMAQASIWRNSEALWRGAVEVDPTCSMCESNLGRVLARPGRFDEATAHVKRAMELRPDRPGPYENLGVIMLAQGRFREAEEHFRRAATLRPNHGGARNSLAAALAYQGRDAEAETEFKEAARLSPRFPDAPANLGMLYVRQGRYAEAIGALRQALAIDPEQAAIKTGLARALRSQAIQLAREGHTIEAAGLWREAVPLAPGDPQLLRTLQEVAPGLAAEPAR
jgi:Flp pilus assembly protein TadD